MKAPLKLEILKFEQGFVFFKIKYQRYRGHNFYPNKTLFRAKNGLCLVVSAEPEYFEQTLYVRGKDRTKDHAVLSCVLFEYLQLLEAVKEYNEQRSLEVKYDERLHHSFADMLKREVRWMKF